MKSNVKYTTLNMSLEVLAKLNKVAKKTGKSRTKIIKYCLLKFAQGNLREKKTFSITTYQKQKSNWHCFHLRLTGIEYEQCFDLRKAYKLSLSLIVALGIEEYCNLLLCKRKSAASKLLIKYSQNNQLIDYFSNYTKSNRSEVIIYKWIFPSKRD